MSRLQDPLPFCRNRIPESHKIQGEHLAGHAELYYKVCGRSTGPIYLAKLTNVSQLLVCYLDQGISEVYVARFLPFFFVVVGKKHLNTFVE